MASLVRRATSSDFEAIAAIHHEAFPRQRDSEIWVKATLTAAPRVFVYALVQEGEIAGYIFWAQKSGIRLAAVIELEQIAVQSKLQGIGLGERLIKESLALVTAELAANGQSVKSLLISTRVDNEAQHLYARVLGAKVVAEIKNLYSATEVLMIAESPGA